MAEDYELDLFVGLFFRRPLGYEEGGGGEGRERGKKTLNWFIWETSPYNRVVENLHIIYLVLS